MPDTRAFFAFDLGQNMLFPGSDGLTDPAFHARAPTMSMKPINPTNNFEKIASSTSHMREDYTKTSITFIQAAAYGATMFGSAALNNLW
jgi:hypothetical protein